MTSMPAGRFSSPIAAAYGKLPFGAAHFSAAAAALPFGISGGGASAPSEPAVPLIKEEEVVCGIQERDSPAYRKAGPDSATVHKLEMELATSYYWSGNFFKDMLFFYCNWHPVLGMFCSHPCHPWSKKERIATFFVSCSLTVFPASLIAVWAHDGGTYEVQQVAPFFICIVVTLPVMILEIALYWIAIIDIYFKGGGCCSNIAVGVTKCIRQTCFCSSLVISTLILLLSWVVLDTHDPPLHPEAIMRTFLTSRLQSWILWFPIWFCLPCIGFFHVWCQEKGALNEDSDSER